MNNTSTNRVSVEPGGKGVAAHVGPHALGSLADALGLGSALTSCIEPSGERPLRHDRGKVLMQMALVLTGGGESCADVEHLRAQSELFGDVPSDSTVYRTFHEFDAAQRENFARALADVRQKIWAKIDVDVDEPVILDFDASLVMGLAESTENAAPTYKGGFGFQPMFCFSDLTGETLSPTLRPGNATPHSAANHVEVLDAVLCQLPVSVSGGRGVGDEVTPSRRVIARDDNAGCTRESFAACRARRVNFSVTARANAQLQSAIYSVSAREDLWQPSRTQHGELREGASVCEVTDYLKLKKMPSGTRCIVRREPLCPGAQRSLFPSDEFRYWGFYTDCEDDPTELDVVMQAHAHVEDHVQRLKESGLTRFPFTSFEANANWLMTVAMADALVRCFQLLCLEGRWRDERPKALRWEIFHAPGRVVRSSRRVVVRLLDDWPTARQLLGAYQRIALLT
ncbi:MAG TPA: IS1380 family transposase [Acidimicrobiales bacterium]|nr:IS1380 family transposase [Acidimicrobiales bacterium]